MKLYQRSRCPCSLKPLRSAENEELLEGRNTKREPKIPNTKNSLTVATVRFIYYWAFWGCLSFAQMILAFNTGTGQLLRTLLPGSLLHQWIIKRYRLRSSLPFGLLSNSCIYRLEVSAWTPLALYYTIHIWMIRRLRDCWTSLAECHVSRVTIKQLRFPGFLRPSTFVFLNAGLWVSYILFFELTQYVSFIQTGRCLL